MEALAIVNGCTTLIKTLTQVGIFIAEIHTAPNQIKDVSTELKSLKNALEQLRSNSEKRNQFIRSSEARLRPIIEECEVVVERIKKLIESHTGRNAGGRIWKGALWSLDGESEVNRLRENLRAHTQTLQIALVAAVL